MTVKYGCRIHFSTAPLSHHSPCKKNLAQYFLQTLNDNSKVVLILFAEFASNEFSKNNGWLLSFLAL
jgi:hypothetical protein